MRIKRKYFLGKLLLLVLSCAFCVWYFRNDNTRSYTKSDSFRHFGVNPFRFSELSETLTWISKQCVSSVGKVKVTADFTLNDVLDHMTIDRGEMHTIKGVLQSNITKFIHNKISKRYKSEPLEIIVIPHSHNDPGWKKTYMKYFEDQTTHILTNIVEKLTQYPDMTFIWVESCFLDVWWRNQTETMKARFRSLVKSKRLEIVSGMWVAPDEASPHYYQILDQMIEGHYWIKKNLDVVPESSLNFDQFGYSNSIPYLVKKAGLKNVLIKRIHRAVKELMGEKKWMTFQWRQFWDPEGHDDIRGHVDTYEWMSISDSCGPDRTVCKELDFSVQSDLPIPGSIEANKPIRTDYYTGNAVFNLHELAKTLVKQFKLKAENYRQKVMMMPHGGDFHYSKADDWDRQHRNMRLFMNYVNEHEKEFKVHMRFGTLKDYYDKLEEQTKTYNLKYPVVSGDFFTYTESDEYWTGYFTTRMFDKRLSRELIESLRAAELFAAVVFNCAETIPEHARRKMLNDLVTARQDLGVFMHHDAVTGTSRAHVVIDYEERLSKGFTRTQSVLSTAVQYLIHNTSVSEQLVHSSLHRAAHDSLTKRVPLPVTVSGTKIILVNSLTQVRREIVTLTIDSLDVIVLDHRGERIEFDSMVVDETVHVVFEVRIPPVSLLIFTIKEVAKSSAAKTRNSVKNISFEDGFFTCENSHVNVTFSDSLGSPSKVCYKSESFCTKLEIDWRHYVGHGGAYTMLSLGTEYKAGKSQPKVYPFIGTAFCGVKYVFDVFTVFYKLPITKAISGRAIRVEVKSDLSKLIDFSGDLAMRLNTGIKNGDEFYVDSNGLQLLKRKFRESIPFDGNVYPMTSMAVIEDNALRLILHSAQPHGVVSGMQGNLDVMIDRVAPRPEMDLPEGATDNKPTKVLFFIEFESRVLYDKPSEREMIHPSINSVYLNDILQHPIYTLFASGRFTPSKSLFTFLKQKVPCDVVIANVKNLATDSYKSDGISMTLFRRGISCSTKHTEIFCPLFEPMNLKPSELFGQQNSVPMDTKEMFLSHLMEKGSLTENDVINIGPMDIKTFHLTRR